MKTLRMTIDLEYDDTIMYGHDLDAKEWFFNNVIHGDYLLLNDNGDIGDTLGKVRVIDWHFLEDPYIKED